MTNREIKLKQCELTMDINRDGLRVWAVAMDEIKTGQLHFIDGLTWEQFCEKECPGMDMEIIESCIAIGLAAPETQN